MPDDLTGYAIVAAACVLGAAALAIAVRCSQAVRNTVAILLALAPVLSVAWQVAATLYLACALLVGFFVGGWLGWYAADVKTADTDARAKALEGQLATARQIADASGERYLRRLRLCSGCVTCNPAPQGPGDPDYDVKLIGEA